MIPEEWKKELSGLPFIIAAWISTSGKGVHAIAYVEFSNLEQYHFAFYYLSVFFKKEFAISLCQGSNASTQLTFMPYDANPFINQCPTKLECSMNPGEVIEEFKSLFRRSPSKTKMGKIDLDPDLERKDQKL